MKRIPLVLLILVLTIGISVFTLTPAIADSSLSVVSDASVQIIGVYNEAGGTSNYVDLSSAPLNAVVADEPNSYTPGGDLNSLWDTSTGLYFQDTNPGANWIWETSRAEGPATYNPSDPLYDPDASTNGRVVVFQKTFTISGNPQYATLHVAADNCYEVWINGNHVALSDTAVAGWETSNLHEASVYTNGWQTVGHYTDLAQYLVNGQNIIKIVAGNEYFGTEDGQSSPYTANPYYQGNPGALIFKLDVDSVTPPVPELPAGALFGLGLVGLVAFSWIGYRKIHTSAG